MKPSSKKFWVKNTPQARFLQNHSLIPDLTLDCDLRVACVLDYADQADRLSRLMFVFPDEEAPTKPREEAHERLHGVLADAKTRNHREEPGLAQRRDLEGEFSILTCQHGVSNKKLHFKG